MLYIVHNYKPSSNKTIFEIFTRPSRSVMPVTHDHFYNITATPDHAKIIITESLLVLILFVGVSFAERYF